MYLNVFICNICLYLNVIYHDLQNFYKIVRKISKMIEIFQNFAKISFMRKFRKQRFVQYTMYNTILVIILIILVIVIRIVIRILYCRVRQQDNSPYLNLSDYLNDRFMFFSTTNEKSLRIVNENFSAIQKTLRNSKRNYVSLLHYQSSMLYSC